ncbi:hypothetical protein AM464_15315 [Escherichia coli]|nr:hypothetical protein AM464_15315 [Escherichia coli]
MFHTIVSIKNDGHYFCRAGGNRPDGLNEPVTSLSTSTQTRVSASSCKVEFRHGNMTLENPSPELLTVLIRELTGRGR